MGGFFDKNGVTFVELLVALAIFSFVIAGFYGVYTAQMKHSTREYRLAESEMELGIAKTIIERDIMMAGYGMADDYGALSINPLSMNATDATLSTAGDSISLRGTAIGILSRTTQGWSYITGTGPPATFKTWSDDRENITPGDQVIYIEPHTREILTNDTTAIFTYPAIPSTAAAGDLVYGLNSESADLPYCTVQYLTGGTHLSTCAPGTLNLLRAESSNDDPPLPGTRRPILNCVRDFQVALGLDTDGNGTIDAWDPISAGTFLINSYDMKSLKRHLKQVRIYILVQVGNRDPDYTYSNPDNPDNPNTIRVGDSSLGAGRDITLTTEQRRYRWRVIALSITPRNLR
jgi:prepilin-type N-terminal cleavage/methylation domain-containing protein